MGDLKERLEERFRRADNLNEVFRQEIFEPFKGKIYNFICRKLILLNTPDPMAASEDLTQDVLTKASNQIGKRLSINEAWIFKVADNDVKNYVKQFTAGPRVESLEEPITNTEGKTIKGDSIPDSKSKHPEQKMLKKELEAQIDMGLQQLSSLQRNSFVLHYLEGYRYSAIAKILSTTEESAKDAAYRARLNLKEDLQRYLAEKPTNISY